MISRGAARVVATPTVLQMEAAECGAAALAIVLGHFGRWVSLEELRIACGVSRDGSKAGNMLRAARSYGLTGDGVRCEPADLAQLALPLIVFWALNHFVVVEGRRGRNWQLNDPACGRRRVSDEEFNRSFSGIALVLAPGPEFRRGGERPSSVRGLMRRVASDRAAFAHILLLSLAMLVPGLAIPAFSRAFVDEVLIGHTEGWLWPLAAGMVGTALLMTLFTWLQLHALLRFESKLAVTGATRFLGHVLRLPIAYFSQRFAGDLSQRVLLNDRVATLLSRDLGRAALSLMTAGVFAVVMLQYDVLLTLVAVAASLINLLALAVLMRRLRDGNQVLLNDTARWNGVLRQGLQMIDILKAAGAEALLLTRLSGLQARILRTRQQVALGQVLLATLPPALSLIATAAVLVVGGLRVMDGALTIGMLVAFQALMASFSAPLAELVGLAGHVQDARANLTRLEDAARQPQDGEFAREGAVPAAARLSGAIELRHVTFGYSALAPPLIQDFSLVVSAGTRIGVVGASGSGKSTLGKLIAGLYPPWLGEVLLDGQSIGSIPRGQLRAAVAMVDQSVVLFEGTIRDNLNLWDETLTDERLSAAARQAAVHDVIISRPGGYGAKVAEAGRNLSGGQRSRLEIARALALAPRILILDEATAALDTEAEQEISVNLRRLGCTSIVIAHRLSTIRDCDEIVVLEQGRCVQRGSHASLKDIPGLYRTLMES